MGSATIRKAEASDAPFLARGILESDRGHVGVGTWDFILPMSDGERLNVLEAVVVAPECTYLHWSTFLVAEVDGAVVGCVATYVPDDFRDDELLRGFLRVLEPTGWDEQRLVRSFDGARSRDYFSVRTPSDAPRIEWVFTDPNFRGRSVSSALIAKHLESSAKADWYVGTYIGNTPAIATYEKVGFEVFAEQRHADYERRFKARGIVSLRRLGRA